MSKDKSAKAKETAAHSHGHEHTHTHGHTHGHGHDHAHHHGHTHEHDHAHTHEHSSCGPRPAGDILVIRSFSGLSGDMLLAGLARMANVSQAELDKMAEDLGVKALKGSVVLEEREVSTVNGWTCKVKLPHEHAHRSLVDIRKIIADSDMDEQSASVADATFTLLAEAEGEVHGKPAEEVTFHEVGALDSILDICLAAMLFNRVSPDTFICGSLPLCDGAVKCAHGLMPTPAPAVLKLLQGVPVRGIPSSGETVTPTAIALLKGLGVRFGEWPEMIIERQALVYGTRVLPNVPNGAIFAYGRGVALTK